MRKSRNSPAALRAAPADRPERLEPSLAGLERVTLKKAYTDGTVAVDMDPPTV